jgi:hypothetical protein
MSKHTPGPWEVDPLGLGTPWSICDQRGDQIALANERLEDPRRVKNPPMRDANARLIAAAPELLEALQMYELFANEAEEHGETPVSRTLLRAARAWLRAAIAKAEGEAV